MEATRAQSAATARTKQQQARRYDGLRAKAETDGAKSIADINREMVRLTPDQQRLDKALGREQITLVKSDFIQMASDQRHKSSRPSLSR